METSKLNCDESTAICSINENTKQPIEKTNYMKNDSKAKLIYYYDPLCGWCYGFSAVMTKLEKAYHQKVDFEVISGGLFLANRAGKINEVAPHIKAGAYKMVESRTGVKFGESFLKDVFGEGKMILNSLPPSIALCIVKEKFPEQGLKFAELLLKAVYYDGVHPSDTAGLAKYAAKVGFDQTEFLEKMENPVYKNKAEKEFEQFQNSQFRGMPALLLQTPTQQVLLSNGFTNFEELKTKLDQLL